MNVTEYLSQESHDVMLKLFKSGMFILDYPESGYIARKNILL